MQLGEREPNTKCCNFLSFVFSPYVGSTLILVTTALPCFHLGYLTWYCSFPVVVCFCSRLLFSLKWIAANCNLPKTKFTISFFSKECYMITTRKNNIKTHWFYTKRYDCRHTVFPHIISFFLTPFMFHWMLPPFYFFQGMTGYFIKFSINSVKIFAS